VPAALHDGEGERTHVGVIAVNGFAGAYCAERIRGAALAAPKGRSELAPAAGLPSLLQGMRYIVFAGMLGYLIPAATDQPTSLACRRCLRRSPSWS
jgi:ABC-type amino acid transport system permease subunit